MSDDISACTLCAARWPVRILDNFGRCPQCGLDAGPMGDTPVSMEDRLRAILDTVTVTVTDLRTLAETRGEWVDWTAHKWLSDSLYDIHAAWSTVALDNERRKREQA